MSKKKQRLVQLEPRLFMTEAELAARWRHSLRTLQRWRAGGAGPAHLRFGRRIVYRIADVETYEASQEGDE